MISVHQAASDSFQSFIQRVRSLNLRSLVYQLQHSPVSQDWTTAQTQKIITHYFAFLYLIDRYPNLVLVPTQDVDHVWHCHILDTEKYAADCQTLFGCFIHHFPFFGIDFESDSNIEAEPEADTSPDSRQNSCQSNRRQQLAAAVLTQVLFRKHFGCTMGEFTALPADCEPLTPLSDPGRSQARPSSEFDFMPLILISR